MKRQIRDEQNEASAAPAAAQRRLFRLTLLARAALLLERLARALWPSAVVIGLFIALSWTGVWLNVPHFARIAGVGLLMALLLAALAPLRHFTFPKARDARDALDAQSSDAPASTLADALANDRDPRTQGLWRLHLKRAEKSIAGLAPIRPAPRLWALDRRALGALTILALVAGGFVAGPEKYARLAAAFDWRSTGGDSAPLRIDAWIDPPAYTGKPPIVLPLNATGAPVSAPVGSTIVVRTGGNAGLKLTPEGGLEKTQAQKPSPDESRFILRGDGGLKITNGVSELARFSLHGIPDAPPTIAPLGPPQVNLRGSFALAYRIEDDYGAKDAEASATPSAGWPEPDGHALVAPPAGPLELAAAPGGLGEARSTLGWSDSPYAGGRVDLTLRVRDEGGNEGQSIVKDVLLPGKSLANPLARALAEQRRSLALDSGQRGRVLASLDALMIAPDLFTPKASIYLGLRYARSSLRRARTDADLVAVCDFLWDMALTIEDGDAPQAERELRAAQKALREALNRGAPPEEIARLTQQLQKALENFLNEMARQAAKNPQSGEAAAGDSESLSPQDLKSMLDKLNDAARDGDKDAALAMLDKLQEIMENMRMSQGSGQSGQAARDRRTMRDIDKLMREQQKLRDDTFSDQRGESSDKGAPRGQGNRPGRPQAPGAGQSGGDEGQSSAEAGESGEPLDARQKQLRDRLESLQQRSMRPDGQGSKGLAEADAAMKQAERALRQGDGPGALEAQARALDGLRKGAGEIASKGKEGSPGGQEGESDKSGGSRGENGEGPFGQANRRSPIDATAAQAARKVLEELRRRLSDPNRAREELDYLERLTRPD